MRLFIFAVEQDFVDEVVEGKYLIAILGVLVLGAFGVFVDVFFCLNGNPLVVLIKRINAPNEEHLRRLDGTQQHFLLDGNLVLRY